MTGRGWRGRPMPIPWERAAPLFRPPPPLFRGGFAPRPPVFYPGGPTPSPPWRHGGPRGRGRGRFSPRGSVEKRGGKFGGRGGGGGRGKPNWKNNRNSKSIVPGKRLTEEDIGVTEYISNHEGFIGIIKSRFSDFQVNEINLSGEVARLTSLEVPEPPAREEVAEDEDLVLSKYNLDLLPLETWDKINTIAISTSPVSERVEVDVTGMTKEERTKIHDAVRKAFGDAIVGSTVPTSDNKKLVRFDKFRKGVRIDNRVRWPWSGEYVHFIVHKENCDTMDAANKIAERLNITHVKSSMLGYAGTKDRRGKTSQWFSVRRVMPKRIAGACAAMRELHVGNFSISNTHLRLGMLRGNVFRIALRNVTVEDEVVNQACENLKQHGFINYYGLQRFGTRFDTPTYAIGVKMLQSNFREAIEAILEPHVGPMEQALQTYKQTRDAVSACELIPRHSNKTTEAKLLRALARDPKDLVGALGKLPRNTRLLYVHAYQSLVWNKCVSHRISTLGLQPVAGDLVLKHKDTLQSDADHSNEEESDEEEGGENHDTEQPAAGDKSANGHSAPPKVPVHILTQEEAESGRYTLHDVVMPLPGYSVEYPPSVRDHYAALLSEDKLTTHLTHHIKSYSMSGAYRFVAARADDLTWSCVRYTKPDEDLILSDLQQLQNQQLSADPDGKYKALLLTMSLPASCYATMALRELLKVDTSGDAQALLNNYHMENKDKQDQSEEKLENNHEGDQENNEEDAQENKQEEASTDKQQMTGSEENSKAEKRSVDWEEEGDIKRHKTDE